MNIAELMTLLLPLYAVMIVGIIGFMLFRKSRNRGKIPCIILKRNRKLAVTYKRTEGSTILTDWKQNPTYKPSDFYEEEKSSLKFWRLARRFLVIPEHAKKALSGKFTTFNAGWTEDEDKKYIAKMVAKARQKGQLISNTWGILILAGIAVLFFTVFMGFSRIGAF